MTYQQFLALRLALLQAAIRYAARKQQALRAAQRPQMDLQQISPRDLVVQRVSQKVAAVRDQALDAQAQDAVFGIGKDVLGAGLASLAAGGGFAGAAAAAEAAAAAAPIAVPLAAAGIITSIVLPTIVSGELFSNKIDPYFDATTPAAQARSRAQAALIKQDLADTGYKFARKTGTVMDLLGG